METRERSGAARVTARALVRNLAIQAAIVLIAGCEVLGPSEPGWIRVVNLGARSVVGVHLSPGATMDSIGHGWRVNELRKALVPGDSITLYPQPECYAVAITNDQGGVGGVRPVCVGDGKPARVEVGK